MKRIGIYITVILIFGSGIFLKGFAQNSKIESISMTRPLQDTIYDPASDSIEIQVSLDSYFTWEDSPPDSIGFFSLDNDFSWTEREVTNTTLFQPEYKAVSPVYNFVNEINTVYFWLKDEAEGIDSLSSYVITYNKPQVKEFSVSSADIIPGTSDYVVYSKNPELYVRAGSWFESTVASSFITRIALTDEATSLSYTLWEKIAGESQHEVTTALPGIFTLEPGVTRCFSIVATGKTAPGFVGIETSEEYPFCLTLMSIEVPDTICQVNSLISLEAKPAGGSFEGKGIVDNTNYFNPSLADANAYNAVTYTNRIGGAEFSVSKDIYVINLPDIALGGDLEVCANSTDVVYTILNPETSKYYYHWQFTGVAEILDSTAVTRTVRWDADPDSYTGKIRITLEGKNETQCPAAFEYLVDIDPDDAPDKPCVCFGDIAYRLLLCSNTNAAYYAWYTDSGDSLGFTEKPYFYLTEDIVKYHQIEVLTTRYMVRIANQLTGCYTTGYMCDYEYCNGSIEDYRSGFGNEEEMSVSIVSNPVHNDLRVAVSGFYSGPVTLKIVNLNGAVLSTFGLNKIAPAENYRLSLDNNLKPGIYLVVCQYGNNLAAPVKLIVY
jgi:hypothetical protein